MLAQEKLPHQVLNAKQHEREAQIVAQAGRPGVITIATNMAGRGTDIVLGGNVEKQVDLLVADERGARGRQAGQHRAAARRMAVAPRPGPRGRRPAHHRHRAARVAPHRQPVARPIRAPGRPGFVALLPVDGRPAAEDLRGRPAQGDHGPPEAARRRGDRGGHRHAIDRERAAQGRGPQLRHPQAAARVRRRRQRPAQDRLLRSQFAAGVRGVLRAAPGSSPPGLHRPVPPARARGQPRGAVGRRRPAEGARRGVAPGGAAARDDPGDVRRVRRGSPRAGAEGRRRALPVEGRAGRCRGLRRASSAR